MLNKIGLISLNERLVVSKLRRLCSQTHRFDWYFGIRLFSDRRWCTPSFAAWWTRGRWRPLGLTSRHSACTSNCAPNTCVRSGRPPGDLAWPEGAPSLLPIFVWALPFAVGVQTSSQCSLDMRRTFQSTVLCLIRGIEIGTALTPGVSCVCMIIFHMLHFMDCADCLF